MEIVNIIPSRLLEVPIDGVGADIPAGAVVMPGTTYTDSAAHTVGAFVLGSGACDDALGILTSIHDFSAVGDTTSEDGAVYVKGVVMPFLPGCQVAAELINDASNDIDVSSYTSADIVISASDDNNAAEGGWVYVRAGTGVGQLMYIVATSSTHLIPKAAPATALDNTSKLVFLGREGALLSTLDSTGVYISSDLTSPALPWRTIRNEIKYDGLERWVRLSPKDHSPMTGLNSKNVKFRSIMVPTNTFFAPVD